MSEEQNETQSHIIWLLGLHTNAYNVFKPGARHSWFLEIAFVCEVSVRVCVCMCVSAPKAINYIHVILKLYNQLNNFVAFRNVMKLSMHGYGHCN